MKSITTSFKLWLKAIRAPFFTATIIPVVLGAILAWHDTNSFIWHKFILTLLGIIFIHTGTNLINDYADHLSGNDKANPTPTPFSGGSRVIQDGELPAAKILFAALGAFFVGSLIGLYLNYVSNSNIILAIGIIGIFLGFFYSMRPLQIGYGSLGELAVGIGFGPLVVIGSYYVQANTLSPRVFLVSLPIGILIALVLLINEFPDYQADKKVGKKTLVVLWGRKKTILLYNALLVSVYLLIISLVVARILPAGALITLITLPLAIKALSVSSRNFDKIDELLPANAATIALHSLIGILLGIGLILEKVCF